MYNLAYHVRAAARCKQPLGFYLAHGDVVMEDDSSGVWALAQIGGEYNAQQLCAGIRSLLEFRWGVRVR